ncbi:MAG: ankyrin repeat domain-containing protein [Phycisphaerales bacterium]|nr:ankyrin repeat domain-containing protein [Phycisphaerales bacterium]
MDRATWGQIPLDELPSWAHPPTSGEWGLESGADASVRVVTLGAGWPFHSLSGTLFVYDEPADDMLHRYRAFHILAPEAGWLHELRDALGLPTSPIVLGQLLGTLTWSLAWLALLWALRVPHLCVKRYRRLHDLCPACGYARGIPPERPCPECGTPLHGPVHPVPSGRLALWFALVGSVGMLLALVWVIAVSRDLHRAPSALEQALEERDSARVLDLLDHGVGVDSPLAAQPWLTPLMRAAELADAETVALLLERGADVSSLTAAGSWPPLYFSLVGLRTDEAESRPAGERQDGDTTRDVTVRPRLRVISQLLDAGADPNVIGGSDLTVLALAIQWSRATAHDVVELLLARGADPDGKGGDALHEAASDNSIAMLELLMQHGAHLNDAITAQGNTVLHSVGYSKEDAEEMVAFLLRHGADPKLPNADGDGPLMLACQAGASSAAEQLLNAGADIDCVNNSGQTALLLACGAGSVPTVKLLLSAGADLSATDAAGRTAIDYACESATSDITELVDLLRRELEAEE